MAIDLFISYAAEPTEANKVLINTVHELAKASCFHADKDICENARMLLGKSLFYALFSDLKRDYRFQFVIPEAAERSLKFAIAASKSRYRTNVFDRYSDYVLLRNTGVLPRTENATSAELNDLEKLRRFKVLLHNFRRELVRESTKRADEDSGRDELCELVHDCQTAWALICGTSTPLTTLGGKVAEELKALVDLVSDGGQTKKHIRNEGRDQVHKVLKAVHKLGIGIADLEPMQEVSVGWRDELSASQREWHRVKVTKRDVADVNESLFQSMIFDGILERSRVSTPASQGTTEKEIRQPESTVASSRFDQDVLDESRRLEKEYDGQYVAFFERIREEKGERRFSIYVLTHGKTYEEVEREIEKLMKEGTLTKDLRKHLFIQPVERSTNLIESPPRFAASDDD